MNLGREWSVQLLADGCLRLQGKAEFTMRRDRAAGRWSHCLAEVPSCFVTDKLLLPNELPLVG